LSLSPDSQIFCLGVGQIPCAGAQTAIKWPVASPGPLPPARSPVWGWGWSGDALQAGRRDASTINRCHHAGAAPCWTGLFPALPVPLRCPAHATFPSAKSPFSRDPTQWVGGTGLAGAALLCAPHTGLSRMESEDGKSQERPIAAMH